MSFVVLEDFSSSSSVFIRVCGVCVFTTTVVLVDSSIALEMLRSSTLVDDTEANEDGTCTSALELVSECFGEVLEHISSTSNIADNNGALPGFSSQSSVFIASDTKVIVTKEG